MKNKYLCAVYLYCQCRQRNTEIYIHVSQYKKHYIIVIIIIPHAETNITTQRAALNRLFCSQQVPNLVLTHRLTSQVTSISIFSVSYKQSTIVDHLENPI